MNGDPLASSTLSIVLAWVFAIPLLVLAISAAFSLLVSKTPEMPKWFVLWVTASVLALSPIRYMLLQVLIGIAFPVQAFRAWFSTLPLILYIPIVFGLLAMIGIGLPLFVTMKVSFGNLANPVFTRTRLLA